MSWKFAQNSLLALPVMQNTLASIHANHLQFLGRCMLFRMQLIALAPSCDCFLMFLQMQSLQMQRACQPASEKVEHEVSAVSKSIGQDTS